LSELLRRIKHACLDLDGTLYLGSTCFEWTGGFLRTLQSLGIGRTFVSNNSSRSRIEYVAKLTAFGIECEAEEVWLSTQAMIAWLLHERPDLRRIHVLGTPSLVRELADAGFDVADRLERPDAVLVGFDSTLDYERLCRAATWIAAGCPFLATHMDRVCPNDAPTVLVDCGSICACLTAATGREPDFVAGKPEASMLQPILDRYGLEPSEVLVVGDRVYTDIEMAHRAGTASVLVLSGEASAADAAHAAADVVVANVGELGRLLEAARD